MSYKCTMTPSCVSWLIHIGAMIHSYVCHDSFTCMPWLMHTSNMPQLSPPLSLSLTHTPSLSLSLLSCSLTRALSPSFSSIFLSRPVSLIHRFAACSAHEGRREKENRGGATLQCAAVWVAVFPLKKGLPSGKSPLSLCAYIQYINIYTYIYI